MGWNNPPVRGPTWSGRCPANPRPGDGGDSPAWTRHRERYQAPPGSRPPGMTDQPDGDARVPYAELHCHSNFSFLDGANHPEELVETAAAGARRHRPDRPRRHVRRRPVRRGRQGARRAHGVRRRAVPRPARAAERRTRSEGEHLLVLAQGPGRLHRLCRVLSGGHLRPDAEKGRPSTTWTRSSRARALRRAHRLPQGRGAPGARRARPGRRASSCDCSRTGSAPTASPSS